MKSKTQTRPRPPRRALVAKSIVRGPALSLGSQLIGLAQLLVLLWRVGANESTDAYFYLFNIGMLPIQIVIVGVMYPLLLNDDKITRRAIKRLRWLTPLLCSLLVAAGAGWLYISERLGPDLAPIAVASLVNATLQARVWFRAVTAEAAGNPRWISGVALPANFLALLILLFPFSSAPSAVLFMICGLIIGNSVLLVVMARLRVGDEVVRLSPRSKAQRSSASLWFLGKAGIGYVGLTVLQSLAVLLPASAVTLLNLAVKIVGSISATLVNSVMPILVHQKIDSPAAGRKFLRILTAGLVIASSLGIVGVAAYRPELTVPAVCLSLWAVASAAAGTAQRMSFRFLKPSASRVTILAVPVVVGFALASVNLPGFQLVVLLCAYAGVDAATSTLLLVSLKDRLMSAILGGVSAGLAGIWFFALR
ncbi:hypothetical protein [Arthrobacter oryzae]|uniref:hypothetical protein n=1 Tax=Arthrobacter oryzae TaxID=409290 RepID=UPI002861BC74|nr:hypothetical protein [Arthrobacter oryzae]MDR6505103.1 hypothetical protein [Arthrobacter oryzae]